MNREKKLTREVEKTMASLDHFEAIKAGPDFYSQVDKKIRNLSKPQKNSFKPRFGFPLLRPALLIIIILFNLVSIVLLLQEREPGQDSRDEYIATLMDEYNLVQSNYYFNYEDK